MELEQALRQSELPSRRRVLRIVSIVSQITGIDPDLLLRPCRIREVTHARFILIRRVRRDLPRASFPLIGRLVGGRDHATIYHALRRAEDMAFLAAEVDRQLDEPGQVPS
jgi:chromosomal replication initiation ATPase DnaA